MSDIRPVETGKDEAAPPVEKTTVASGRLWACPTCGALCPKENEAAHLGWHEWLAWKLNEGPRRAP